ncbi:hypothetical protein HN592_01805 [Candidatus Woesearchaeota archaeon]|jgi:hypothetical protein|nr:hypothetical protein [Candidatus Woesearchaeota archaeon]MBT4368583.1 hypothetical protein [Candidatus Woesearchaeota archaeon]MBT4713108.1 hypothetical protein [Candidatus Woesearchaeota archaeon]MBT6639030.1 hypothetical protein [Candidatus Woesearchaeota archaeon]MBT7134229.1 hypothetical protein [Candidatus Woesearchaeota archaeon]
MKKLLIYALLLTLLVTFVSATDFTVKTTAIKEVIDIEDVASFELAIKNFGVSDSFRVYYNGVEWDIPVVSLDLQHKEQKTITVNARPLYVNNGQHAITLNVKSAEGNEVEKIPLIINVREKDISSYQPSVGVVILMPEETSPDSDLPITLIFKNKNPLELDDIEVSVESSQFSETKSISLESTTSTQVGEASFDLVLPLESTLIAEPLLITFTLSHQDEIIYQNQKSVNVVGFSPDFVVEKRVEKSFFRVTEDIAVKNSGNQNKKQVFKLKTSVIKDLFSSETPDASILKEDGARYLFWELDLEPGEEFELVVVRNYRPFLLFLLILIIVITLYFSLRSPLALNKTAEVFKKDEGGISMLKVRLKLKNISEKTVSDVKIYDAIPHLAGYVQEEHVGSLTPIKVLKHQHKGTLIKWEIPVLEGFEERIISYKIQAQLKILGGLTLPAASGRFKTLKGKDRFSKSNIFKLLLKSKDSEKKQQ